MDRRRGARGEERRRRARVLLAGGCLKSHSVGAGNGIMAIVQICSSVCIGCYMESFDESQGYQRCIYFESNDHTQ